MLTSRRAILKSAVTAPVLALPATKLFGQEIAYPTGPVVSVGMFPAGTGGDIIVRFYTNKLQAALGKPVVVEIKLGMGGSMAAGYVAQAKPDGYTIFMSSSSALAAAPWLYKKLPYDPTKSFAYVTPMFQATFVMVVPSNSPHKTLADLTDYLRKKGDKGGYGSATNFSKVASSIYKSKAGLSTVEVPYKSGLDALNDLHAGLIDFYFTDSGTIKNQIAPGGKLRALMTTSHDRFSALPGVPSAKEAGIDMNLVAYWALYVPTGTPQPVIEKLAKAMAPIVASEEAKAFLANLGFDPWLGNGQMVGEMIDRETKLWSEYVKLAGIQAQ